jgi:rare lipoprotein A
MKKLFVVLSIVGACSTAAAQTRKDSVALNKRRNVSTVQYGIASFYADKFEGRKTCTDEIFSQSKLTAACNTLPLNCWVRVTNMKNKKSVVVRINDRMHPANPRLIDMSKAAARTLGFTGAGLARVKIEYLGRKKPDEALLAGG